MNDEKTAADYKVQGGSVLHLVLALRSVFSCIQHAITVIEDLNLFGYYGKIVICKKDYKCQKLVKEFILEKVAKTFICITKIRAKLLKPNCLKDVAYYISS